MTLQRILLSIVIVFLSSSSSLLTLRCNSMVNANTIQYETIKNGGPVVCSDTLDNVCIASTDCGVVGDKEFKAGTNFNYKPVQTKDNVYIIQGGYSILFSLACNITCMGNCTCTDCSRQTQLPDDTAITNIVVPSASAGNIGTKTNSTSSALSLTLTTTTTLYSKSVLLGIFSLWCGFIVL